MSEVRIAAARVDDLKGVLRLERAAFGAPHWTERDYREILSGAGGWVKRCLLLAWRGETMVGLAVGKVLGGEAELENLAVWEEERRQGVGRALCGAVLNWAWAQGAEVVELEVRASSAGAIALYAGLGFRACGVRAGYYAGPVENALLMRLERPSFSRSAPA